MQLHSEINCASHVLEIRRTRCRMDKLLVVIVGKNNMALQVKSKFSYRQDFHIENVIEFSGI